MSRLARVLGLALLLVPSVVPATGVRAAAFVGDEPAPPTDLHVAGREGSAVTLAWSPSEPPGTVDAYVVEGGFAPGEVLGRVLVGDAAATVTLDLPEGVYFVRVHALVGQARSAASNELRLVVGAVEPPSAPMGLTGLVSGFNASLSWTNTYLGGTPSALRLDVAGPISGSFPLPVEEAFTGNNLPPGEYTVTVSAENSQGTSPPSNAVTLLIQGPCAGPPNAPTDFQAWRSGDDIVVSWQPPAGGSPASGYRVELGDASAGPFEITGLSIVIPDAPGDRRISVVAHNACGDGPAAPAAPEWTVAVTKDDTQTVRWEGPAAAYRVYWSNSREDLVAPEATLMSFVDVEGNAWIRPAPEAVPGYFRVYRRSGPALGPGGPIALAPAFDVTDYPGWPNVSAAIFDLDGDGCLDLLGGWGHCDGTLEPYPLASVGLEGLAAQGRANRDSRIADFTGDGIPDIFTNVYSRADNPDSYAMLHVGNGLGGFVEDPAVSAMKIGGFGETVLAADFDNDGDLDIFIPNYSHIGDGAHNWLLINDGRGHFVDVSESAGVAINPYWPPEGAQAVDANQDGFIDMLVGMHLLLNNGDLTFTDVAQSINLPIEFDEGERLIDVDLDGDFDLVRNDSFTTRLFVNQNGAFDAPRVIEGDGGASYGYGLNACDVNGDGFEDLLVARNSSTDKVGRPRLLLNLGGTFVPSDLAAAEAVYNDMVACVDLDGSGLPDVVDRWISGGGGEEELGPSGTVGYRTYLTRGEASPPIRLRIVGEHGERNQQGRIVRVRPIAGPDRTMLRVVDSGSGFQAQNGYDVVVATPWPGGYEVSVRFGDGWVTTTASPGEVLTIHVRGQIEREAP